MANDYVKKIIRQSLNMNNQPQPTKIPSDPADEFEKILADFAFNADLSSPAASSTLNTTAADQLDLSDFDINTYIGSLNNHFDLYATANDPSAENSPPIPTPLDQTDDPATEDLIRSIFTDSDELLQSYQPQPNFSVPSTGIGSSPVEPKANDYTPYVNNYVNEQDRRLKAASKSRKVKAEYVQPNAVGPTNYEMHSGGCQPYTTATVQMESDYAYEQQWGEYDASETKKIQITCHPRAKFRPRTQNESRNSSHYIRCDDGVKPEYPTIAIPYTWRDQSEANIIEVALLGLDKQPHAYAIDNKASATTFEENALIFKQHEPHLLFFRVTEEDFRNGYKTFQLEFIKGKQDETITKELIRTRQLDQSILRFTRIYQAGKSDYHRDELSAAYSSEMVEDYGGVEVEHMGPPYGPMSGQEMVYIVLKGRILKTDLTITVRESTNRWASQVDSFTKNGSVVYFSMPACPFADSDRVLADILVFYKNAEIFQSRYMYKGSLDQELAALRLNDSPTATGPSASGLKHPLNPLNFFSATDTCPKFSSRRASTAKRPKRLSNK